MNFINSPLKEYLDNLFDKKPTPGGGSVAALSAALGVSLIGMVLNYTIGKKGYEAHEKELSDILSAAGILKTRLEELVDEDVLVYGRLRDALKAKASKADMQNLYIESASVPLEVCRLSYDGMEALTIVCDWSNKALISDVGIACELLEAAFYSAKLNVDINLDYIEDPKFVHDAKHQLAILDKNIESFKNSILVKVKDVMYGKF